MRFHHPKESVRIQARWEMQGGGPHGLWLQPARQSERQGAAVQHPFPEHSLRIVDTAYLTSRQSVGQYLPPRSHAPFPVPIEITFSDFVWPCASKGMLRSWCAPGRVAQDSGNMSDELHTITVTLEIEPSALALLQQQADQQGLTLDQLAARYIGRAAAQVETQARHIRAANA